MEMTINSILPFRVQSYARAIFVYGTNRLTARDGYPGVAEGYYLPTFPVQSYAALTYTRAQIDLALACGWLTSQEYDETLVFIV